MGNFKRAKEIDIFDGNGKKWEGKKGLVNEADEMDRFSIVGEGYKVAQHQEVYDIVDKALIDLKVEHKTTTIDMNEGARLRIDLKFPQVVHSIAGESIQLWATFDNSYDGSTGLRLEINAYMPVTDTNFYCSEMVSNQLNSYYHKHTKGLTIGELDGTISKGIEIFQKEIVREFEELVAQPISGLSAKAFIGELVENPKSIKVAKKYLEKIYEAVDAASSRLTTAWGLYSLISSILTTEVAGLDNRKNNARVMLSKIQNHKW